MKKIAIVCAIFLSAVIPVASAISVDVQNGNSTDMGANEIKTGFGMVTGSIKFRIGNVSWTPSEIWMLPADMDPEIFSKGLSQREVIEIPSNVTFSTCRTAVYHNSTVGYGFKVYNTGTTVQIMQNGTFCGLAYNGTYQVFAKY